jgi:transposase
MQVTTIGIDLAKHVFQIHGVDADGGVVVRRKLRRSEVIDFLAKLPPASDALLFVKRRYALR